MHRAYCDDAQRTMYTCRISKGHKIKYTCRINEEYRIMYTCGISKKHTIRYTYGIAKADTGKNHEDKIIYTSKIHGQDNIHWLNSWRQDNVHR